MFGFHGLSGTGKGTKICIMDGGVPVNKHVRNVNTIANFTSDKEARDYQGKSTAVSGILTGDGFGLCQDANLYIAKSINNKGIAQFDAAIAAVLWATIHDIDVLVVPTELEDSCNVLANAFSKAVDNNMVIVMAGSEGYPVLSVKKVSDKISYFAGKNVICVNGENICSTFLNDKFALYEGVSCSVAIVAGTIARLIEKNRAQSIQYNSKLLLSQMMECLIKT
jgi:minor extracellular protease Epr